MTYIEFTVDGEPVGKARPRYQRKQVIFNVQRLL